MTVYKWRSGARMCVSAQVAGEECKRLESEGNLTPKALVDASRPEDAPLHPAFEWDNDVAAERWREEQARHIVRMLEVKVEQVEQPVRAFVSVDVGEEKRSYKDVMIVMRDKSTAAAVLLDAKRELAAFKRKYEGLKELAQVFEAIDRLAVA